MTSLHRMPLSYLPSPPVNGFHIGPLFIHFYGLMYVVGITLAVIITQRRVRGYGGDPSVVGDVAMWAVPAGIIGGRIYFDLTTPAQIPHVWYGVFAVWSGGLGIWGGVAAGALAGIWRLRRRGIDGRAVRRRRRSRAPGRAGRRPDRQLLQPGALRQADRAALGAAHPWPSRRLPAHLPVRADLGSRPSRAPGLARPSHQDPPARPVRPLCNGLLRLPHLRGVPADRLLAALLRPAPEHLRRLGPHPDRHRLVHLHPAPPPHRGTSPASPTPAMQTSKLTPPTRPRLLARTMPPRPARPSSGTTPAEAEADDWHRGGRRAQPATHLAGGHRVPVRPRSAADGRPYARRPRPARGYFLDSPSRRHESIASRGHPPDPQTPES